MSQRRTPAQVATAVITEYTREYGIQGYRQWHISQVQELRMFTSKNKKSQNQSK